MDTSERHEQRLRKTSPTGQASIRRLNRRLARPNGSSPSPATPIPLIRNAHSSLPQNLPPNQPPQQSQHSNPDQSPTPFPESSPTAPFLPPAPHPLLTTNPTTNPKKPNKDSPTSVRLQEATLAATLDNFSAIFGTYRPSTSTSSSPPAPAAPSKIFKAAATITSAVKKGKRAGEARVSIVKFEVKTSGSGSDFGSKKAKKSDAVSRILFPVKSLQLSKYKPTQMDGSDEMAMAIELDLDDKEEGHEEANETLRPIDFDVEGPKKSTPSYASSSSVINSPASASASAPRVRGRFELGDVPVYRVAEENRKRKWGSVEEEGEESPVRKFR